MSSTQVPIVCFVGPSGVGKTTLVCAVIGHLSARGLRVGALKHSHHGFQMDRAGKDTYRMRASGACAIGISSPTEHAVLASTSGREDITELAAALPPVDIVIAEGFKTQAAQKIEVRRAGFERPADAVDLTGVFAIATNRDDVSTDLPLLPLDDPEAIARFLVERFITPRVDGAQD